MKTNEQIKTERQAARDARQDILVGDWVEFLDGSRKQVAHVWETNYVQFGSGSVYIQERGNGEYSGSLTLGVEGVYTRTDEKAEATMWFFDKDWPRAGAAVYCEFSVAIWKVDQLPPKF